MDNKRILTFGEFTKAYSKGDQFSATGNDEKSVDKLQNAADSLTENPIVDGSKGDMDSVDSKPATKFIKTDYEKSPDIPNGPVKLKDVDQEESTEDTDNNDDSEEKAKPVKKVKKESKKSEEDQREESGEY
tara:strand:+ start:15546 stop:15938 length:393 start_codon:yes stop_codon:yes gene_type:complete